MVLNFIISVGQLSLVKGLTKDRLTVIGFIRFFQLLLKLKLLLRILIMTQILWLNYQNSSNFSTTLQLIHFQQPSLLLINFVYSLLQNKILNLKLYLKKSQKLGTTAFQMLIQKKQFPNLTNKSLAHLFLYRYCNYSINQLLVGSSLLKTNRGLYIIFLENCSFHRASGHW